MKPTHAVGFFVARRRRIYEVCRSSPPRSACLGSVFVSR